MSNTFVKDSIKKLVYVTPKKIIDYINKPKYDFLLLDPKWKVK